MEMLPDVATFLRGKRVFVTGVTGFVGLTLVEKLLRTVPDIGDIYVLIRPKRGKNVHERLNEIKSSSIFETLINEGRQSALEKLKALEGDIDIADLGLTDADQETVISVVEYVFHCAATLDFEASLKTTVQINLMGTQRIIQLCKKIQGLKAFIHVSSAYANANRMSAEEIIYPPPENAARIIELVLNMSDERIEEVTPMVLKDHPNTYTFTKALAEHEVINAFAEIPSCIVRPSMIVGVWKDPVPGWTNSKNGPQGFILGAAMGVIRRLPVAKNLIYDYVPVDIVVNTMIVAAVYSATSQGSLTKCPIFQCTSSTYNPFRWSAVEKQITALLHKYANMQAVWYPHLKLLPSVFIYRMSAVIYHMIPAYIFDAISFCCGGRPKLVRLHTSVNQSLGRLEPFIFQEWMFDNSRCLTLHNQLSPNDQEIYGLDIKSLSWNNFFEDMAHGVRRYLLREKDHTLPKARKKYTMLKMANYFLQLCIFVLAMKLVQSATGLPTLEAFFSVIPFFIFVYIFL